MLQKWTCTQTNQLTSELLAVKVPLFSSIVKAWQATAAGSRGLFDRSFDAEAFRNSTDAVSDFGPLVDSVSAHFMWLTYLDEVWKVSWHSGNAICKNSHQVPSIVRRCISIVGWNQIIRLYP